MNIIKALVDRFLGTRLPTTVRPDGVDGDPHRSGTNLMTADEATLVFNDVVNQLVEDAEQWRYACMLRIVSAEDAEKVRRARGL